MTVPQNTIAIVYDYDQTLSPIYMQEEAIFPVFGIDPSHFWKRCAELVQKQGYDHELAYMKVLLDSSRSIDQQTPASANSVRVSHFTLACRKCSRT
jgi:hypothetical protein